MIDAFAEMPERRLVIAGGGPMLAETETESPPNVEVMGYVADDRLADLRDKAQAVLFAGVEDFGIALVEAQAAGLPVIAYRGGGAEEIVRDISRPHPTGLLFPEQSVAALRAALDRFEETAHLFSQKECMANATRFSSARFRTILRPSSMTP